MKPPSAKRRPAPGNRCIPGGGAFLALALLLALPVYALGQFASSIDWRILASVPAAMSLFSYLSYRSDKRRAEAGDGSRRIPEITLHLLDFLGGWPGGFLAQRAYRHKIIKPSFQIKYWLTIAVHYYVAADSLLAWRLTQQTTQFIKIHLR